MMDARTPKPPPGSKRRVRARQAAPSERFQPIRLLGHGGSATVLLANDSELDRKVAIKVLLDRLVGDRPLRLRFEREVELLERLEHPGIVPVLSRGETASGSPWYAMPYYAKGSLSHRLAAEGAIAPVDLVGYALEVLDALAYAHDLGIVHRDIKTDNVLVDEHGIAVLCDFGVAAEPGQRHTRAGAQLGTPVYAAPEQLMDPRLAEPRSDLYSLGVTLFSAATVESPARLVYPHTRKSALALVPQPLRDVVATATQPQVNRRYSSASAMASVLADILPDC